MVDVNIYVKTQWAVISVLVTMASLYMITNMIAKKVSSIMMCVGDYTCVPDASNKAGQEQNVGKTKSPLILA